MMFPFPMRDYFTHLSSKHDESRLILVQTAKSFSNAIRLDEQNSMVGSGLIMDDPLSREEMQPLTERKPDSKHGVAFKRF